jgi:hypothetical protein
MLGRRWCLTCWRKKSALVSRKPERILTATALQVLTTSYGANYIMANGECQT